MIIVLIILFTALAIVGFFFIKNRVLSWFMGLVFILLLVLSIGGLVYHDNTQWGMKKVTTTRTVSIPVQMVMAVSVGENTNNYVFSYKTLVSDSKPSEHFKPDESDIVNAVKISATYEETNEPDAAVVTATTRYEWANSFAQWLFGIGGEAGELVKEVSTVHVPQGTVLVLNASQAAELQKNQAQIAAEAQKAQEAQAQEAITKAVAAATAQVPDAEKAAAAKAAQAQAEAAIAAQEKAIQSNPAEYARLQVQQIKQYLKIN